MPLYGTLCLEVRITKNARMTKSLADARSNIFIYVLSIFTSIAGLLRGRGYAFLAGGDRGNYKV